MKNRNIDYSFVSVIVILIAVAIFGALGIKHVKDRQDQFYVIRYSCWNCGHINVNYEIPKKENTLNLRLPCNRCNRQLVITDELVTNYDSGSMVLVTKQME